MREFEIVPNSDGLSIYEMFSQYGKKPGFWIRGSSMRRAIMKVKSVGPLTGWPPYYGYPDVVVDVYDEDTGEVTQEARMLKKRDKTRFWNWVRAPLWSEEPEFDARNGRVALCVPYDARRKASEIGARWSVVTEEWLADPADTKLMAKAKKLGFLMEDRVFFLLRGGDNNTAKEVQAFWHKQQKVWSLPKSEVEGIGRLSQLGRAVDEVELQAILSEPDVYFQVPYEDRVVANDVWAKWHRDTMLWSVPAWDAAAQEAISRVGTLIDPPTLEAWAHGPKVFFKVPKDAGNLTFSGGRYHPHWGLWSAPQVDLRSRGLLEQVGVLVDMAPEELDEYLNVLYPAQGSRSKSRVRPSA